MSELANPESGTGDSRVGDLAGLSGLRIVRGAPDDVELAALLAAVAAAQLASESLPDDDESDLPAPIQAARSGWNSRARRLSVQGSASTGPLGAASLRFGPHRSDAWRLSHR